MKQRNTIVVATNQAIVKLLTFCYRSSWHRAFTWAAASFNWLANFFFQKSDITNYQHSNLCWYPKCPLDHALDIEHRVVSKFLKSVV
jgi:hypothetical protein